MPSSAQSRPHNLVSLWLELIGTAERAERLLGSPAASGCPSALLFGTEHSHKLYADPRYRPALDAWDTGRVTRRDMLAWAEYIKAGSYAGPVYLTPSEIESALAALA
jgi:hypothetical protein